MTASHVHTGVMRGGEPGRDDIEALEKEFECTFSDDQAFAIVRLVWDYWRVSVAIEEGVPRSVLKKRLQKLAKAAEESARLLGAQDWDFEEIAPIMANREKYPHAQIDWETHNALTDELMLLWGRLKERFPGAPRFFELELLESAHLLAVISNAASAASARIGSAGPGRPEGGSRDLMFGLLDILNTAGAKLTCYTDAVTAERKGSVLKVVAWLKSLKPGVRESEVTLFEHAKQALRLREQKR